jgi:hypothetical protein
MHSVESLLHHVLEQDNLPCHPATLPQTPPSAGGRTRRSLILPRFKSYGQARPTHHPSVPIQTRCTVAGACCRQTGRGQPLRHGEGWVQPGQSPGGNERLVRLEGVHNLIHALPQVSKNDDAAHAARLSSALLRRQAAQGAAAQSKHGARKAAAAPLSGVLYGASWHACRNISHQAYCLSKHMPGAGVLPVIPWLAVSRG